MARGLKKHPLLFRTGNGRKEAKKCSINVVPEEKRLYLPGNRQIARVTYSGRRTRAAFTAGQLAFHTLHSLDRILTEQTLCGIHHDKRLLKERRIGCEVAAGF